MNFVIVKGDKIMKIFKGTPNPNRTNEDHWLRSQHKGWVIVRAENKIRARRIARDGMGDLAGYPGLVNPWSHEDAVTESDNLVGFVELSDEEIKSSGYSIFGIEEIIARDKPQP